MKKNQKNKIFNLALFIIIVILGSIIFGNVMNFSFGYHNTDHCIMMKLQNYEVNKYTTEPLIFSELDTNMQEWSLTECYLTGITQMIDSFIYTALGCFLMGVGLSLMLFKLLK